MHTRRRVVALLGATALAGCSAQETEQPTTNETQQQNQTTNTTASDPDPQRQQLSGREWYFNWIHGEDEEILENVQEDGSKTISFQAIENALDEGIEQGRDQAIANALETASQRYNTETSYEDRHRHILSALHQTLEQKEGEQWDFNIFSNMNYTQTAGETIQYSEIKVQTGDTTDSGHQEYSIINAALKDEYNHATHVPGEAPSGEADYHQTMYAARNSSLDGVLPPHDTEAIQNRIDRGAPESFLPSGAELMRYQLFAGGHQTDGGFGYLPDQMIVPATQEIHEKIDEIGYEQGEETDQNGDPIGTHGRMDLQLAINERYMKEGYEETNNPVVIDNLEETSDGWNFELYEQSNWDHDQGYPTQAS